MYNFVHFVFYVNEKCTFFYILFSQNESKSVRKVYNFELCSRFELKMNFIVILFAKNEFHV